MSIHSSLRIDSKGNKHRSVLKRHERLKVLKGKGAWGEDATVFGLPKVKMQKVKVKKEKAAKAEGAAAPAAGAGAPAAAPAAKAAAPAGKADKK